MNCTSHQRRRAIRSRQGAIAPLFAILLPVVLLVCGVVVNIAYMQLIKTELRVATDAAARAGGRAFSEFQNIDVAKNYAYKTAGLNDVGGKPLALRLQDNFDEIQFGKTWREDRGFGRYHFDPQDTAAVRAKTARATAMRVLGKRDTTSLGGTVNMLFAGFGPFTEFGPVVASTSTQVDRDIALVLDRSGSMAEAVTDYSQYYYYQYYYDRYGRRRRRTVWTNSAMRSEYSEWKADYYEWRDGNLPYPRHSRWEALKDAVNAFLGVLDGTDQEELVSLATYSTSARLDLDLTSVYPTILSNVDKQPVGGWTAIGEGMKAGFPTLYGSLGRPYAAKTIIVLTDGNHNRGQHPIDYASWVVNNYNVTIHTVTFSYGANQTDMKEVARIGSGKHYHADDAAQLVSIFEEIANNLPTIITE